MFEKVRYIGIFSYLSILKFNLKIRWQQTNGQKKITLLRTWN